MFFKQLRRNARKNRKDNGLFFGSLTIAIVAFYTLLSLDSQDVMTFLQKMESDAIRKLFTLIPIVYCVSLFFVFFLVYFACKYQVDNRRREFGLYLMLGMKRSRMFLMLLGETLWNSVISLSIGLPVALLLTEAISLLTARVIGLGILGHRFTLSLPAFLGTIGGFLLVQIVSMLVIIFSLARKEPLDLLRSDAETRQRISKKAHSRQSLIPGILLLCLAYYLGLTSFSQFELVSTGLLFVSGTLGTFLVFRGVGAAIGRRIHRVSPDRSGLFTFTGRQIQESIMYRHKVLAVSSLLLTMGIACLSYGVSVSAGLRAESQRSVDATIMASESEVDALFAGGSLESTIKDRSQMKLAMMGRKASQGTVPFSWKDVSAYIEKNYEEVLFENLRTSLFRHNGNHIETPYLISVDSFNAILRAGGKPEIQLGDHEVAFYSALLAEEEISALETAFVAEVPVYIDGDLFAILPEVCSENLVADRAITPMYALIVPDEMFDRLASPIDTEYWNLFLDDDIVERDGLMQAVSALTDKLRGTGLPYETYLTGIGRNLFNAVAGSYLMIYLGILFTLIANTVISIGFLMRQRENRRRFATLRMLGAETEALCQSTRTQVRYYFGVINAIAAVSGAFGIATLFKSILRLPGETPPEIVIGFGGAVFLAFLVIEFIYLCVVERIGCKQVRSFSEIAGRDET